MSTSAGSALSLFHPAVASWFSSRFDSGPTPAQERAWPALRQGRHVLVAAPTGSGKTLAAFLASLDELVREGLEHGELPAQLRVLYVSPLKALGNDIEKNLQEPLAGIEQRLIESGQRGVGIRTAVRSGDTTASARAQMVKRPPHVLVTTPESLYILLTSKSGRSMLRSVRTVIIDEIHAVLQDKRGPHLALSLERLAEACPRPPLRIGLSATQSPISEVAHFLVGRKHEPEESVETETTTSEEDGATPPPDCEVVDLGHRRRLDLALELPGSPLDAVTSADQWEEIVGRLSALVEEHCTTLVFVNTRRLTERLARHLSEKIGDELVGAHHGSLSKDRRLEAEDKLRSGQYRVLVATASLELGIDIGDIDLVCQVGSTRAIATFLQRIGRAGHVVGGVSKGRLFPLTRDELVECVALLDCVDRGELDRIVDRPRPLDVLAQQVVAEVSEDGRSVDDVFALVKRAWPYRDLTRESFDEVVTMLAEGFASSRGRKGALLHHDAVQGKIRGRRGAKLTAVTSGGAIPDRADYDVLLEPEGIRIGSVDEDFAVESLAGDVFQLGNKSWQILRVTRGQVRVADAEGQPPNIPFWFGEAPARTDELSQAVSRLRASFDQAEGEGRGRGWLEDLPNIDPVSVRQLHDYLAESRTALGGLPTQDRIVAERFFDESGGMQLVIHSPFGARINRGWGLSLRKRFCRKFNFELQAAATENALLLSLPSSYSFPLEEVFGYLRPEGLRDLLIQALLDAPMFATRFRWNAGRSLAIPRFRGGKRMAPQILRMEAEDLIATVFPDQQACLENIAGDREVPDHPLVDETLRDCLEEAMDIDGLVSLIGRVTTGQVELVAHDLPEPSPLADEIITARPYAFLDDAPLEERRTLAVRRRSRGAGKTQPDPEGVMDPQAVAEVKSQAWPRVRDHDEFHDALLVLSFLTSEEADDLDVGAPGDGRHLARLVREGRATWLTPPGRQRLAIATERLQLYRKLWPEIVTEPPVEPLATEAVPESEEDALTEILRGRISALGPVVPDELVAPLGVSPALVQAALLRLESEGQVLRGSFTGRIGEWCERGLLARIQRLTLDTLRQQVAPVSAADYISFLPSWQHVSDRVVGPDGLRGVLGVLAGWEAPAASWEDELIPSRMERHDSSWLDLATLSGEFTWGRLVPPRDGNPGTWRATPITFLPRHEWLAWSSLAPTPSEEGLSTTAAAVMSFLRENGASFLGDIGHALGLLPAATEEALGQLVGSGLVTCDGFAGLRALLRKKTGTKSGGRRPRRTGGSRPLDTPAIAGRWSELARGEAVDRDAAVELVARSLLRRHGVVFRQVLEREALRLPWRDLLYCYRRLEARGEIRGGRFVDRFVGEQFALSSVVAGLRRRSRTSADSERLSISAADPLNVLGVLTPGKRLPGTQGNRLLLHAGRPIARLDGDEVSMLVEMGSGEAWEAEKSLRRVLGGRERFQARTGSLPSWRERLDRD
ncbi:MAG: DEAD/DEAH box helicase [Acidobacteriota bacterium]